MPIKFRNTPVSEPLTFETVGCRWNQERIVRPKGFPLYHYLQTEKGIGRIIIEGKKHLLKEGEGVLIAPSVRHSYSRETEEWFTSFATFTGSLESGISKIIGNRRVIFTEKEQASEIASLISAALEQYENPPVDMRRLSVTCYELLMNFADGIYTRDLLSDPLYQKYVQPVIQEIETHYDSDLTIQALSETVYITPQYLGRLFSRFLGCSAYEYLTTYRINKAKEILLTDPNRKVQDIAGQVGFADSSHFIAMFKKVTGLTPLEFRNLN